MSAHDRLLASVTEREVLSAALSAAIEWEAAATSAYAAAERALAPRPELRLRLRRVAIAQTLRRRAERAIVHLDGRESANAMCHGEGSGGGAPGGLTVIYQSEAIDERPPGVVEGGGGGYEPGSLVVFDPPEAT